MASKARKPAPAKASRAGKDMHNSDPRVRKEAAEVLGYAAADAAKEIMGGKLARRISAEKYRDHPLSGDWSGFRECHVKPDLVLIYGGHTRWACAALAASLSGR